MRDIIHLTGIFIIIGIFFVGCDTLMDTMIEADNPQMTNFSGAQSFSIIGCDITVPSDYTTIQDAINAANSGDRICVEAGTYDEHLVINKDDLVVLSTDGRDVTFITGTHTSFPGFSERVLVGISGDRVTFKGFTLQGVYTNTHDYTISVYGDDVQILDNEIIGDPSSANYDVGIQVWRDSDGSNLEGNIIRTMSHSGISLGGGTLATNVSVHKNQVYDTERDYGIAVDRAPGSIVTENHVEGAGAAGIYVVNRDGRSVAGTVIEGNIIINNPKLGMRIRDAGAPVEDVVVTGNTIVGNLKGISSEGTNISGVTVHYNNIVDNTEYGIQNVSTSVFNATCNWWGDASGPTHSSNSEGIGDPVSDNVDFVPWLTAPAPDGACDGPLPTPYASKQAVIDALQAMLPSGDDKLDKRLEKAIDRLNKSLTPEWWIDGETLDEKDGKKVFDQEKKVVKELSKKQFADNPDAAYLIQVILDADRALAVKAIADAEAIEGSKDKDVEKAKKELEKGDEERAKGKYEQAVDKYKKAWENAQKAIKKAK